MSFQTCVTFTKDDILKNAHWTLLSMKYCFDVKHVLASTQTQDPNENILKSSGFPAPHCMCDSTNIPICMFLQRLYFLPNALEFLYPQKKLNCLSLGNTAIWAEVCGLDTWGMHVKVSVQERKKCMTDLKGCVKMCVLVPVSPNYSQINVFKLKDIKPKKRPAQEAENIHEQCMYVDRMCFCVSVVYSIYQSTIGHWPTVWTESPPTWTALDLLTETTPGNTSITAQGLLDILSKITFKIYQKACT